MLVVENVSMSFGERDILKNVNMTIEEKSITVITGKSGTGKTTLLGIMSGLLKPDSGRVLFRGKNIFRWLDFMRSRYRNKKIGFIFQFFNLLPDMTAYQNIIYPAIINPFSKNIRGEADFLVNYLGISHIKNNYPTTLSGGELQRVAVARSIINRPEVVLADEPTGNLDDATADHIIALFSEIREKYGISFVIVTHEKRFLQIADVHYHLTDGQFVRMDNAHGNAVKKEPKERAVTAAKKKPAAKKAPEKKTVKKAAAKAAPAKKKSAAKAKPAPAKKGKAKK
ncbi:MAG TPA: ABC transporter ATP-binding protein [Spirochaetota bacterium]|nr:ABC transporter ATP-binding protein [Spirochaetota bacterium]HPQ54182.1 ABC transporter ATP-binding protein [Spirochaetota bacterium]